MATLTFLFVVLAGLVFGSFFNVVIYRLPRGLNLSRPPSACPGCGAHIKPYDNVPVISYLLLGGKCRRCGQKISPIYPAVEALTALGFALVYLAAGRMLSLEFFAGCLFTSALIVLGFIDARHQILPDAITLPGLVLALVYAFFRDDLTFRGALLGAVVGAGFLLLVYGAYLLIRKKEGLGMGDVTMMLHGRRLSRPDANGPRPHPGLVLRRSSRRLPHRPAGEGFPVRPSFRDLHRPGGLCGHALGGTDRPGLPELVSALGLRGPSRPAPFPDFVKPDRKNRGRRRGDLMLFAYGEPRHPNDLAGG